jgi:hypothetical protein
LGHYGVGTKLFDISFDVADTDGDELAISVEISDDGGASFDVPVTALSGPTSVSATPAPRPTPSFGTPRSTTTTGSSPTR